MSGAGSMHSCAAAPKASDFCAVDPWCRPRVLDVGRNRCEEGAMGEECKGEERYEIDKATGSWCETSGCCGVV